MFHVERAKLVYLSNKGPVPWSIEDLFGIQLGRLPGNERQCLLSGKRLTATVAVFLYTFKLGSRGTVMVQ
jgi:hypothetical protein